MRGLLSSICLLVLAGCAGTAEEAPETEVHEEATDLEPFGGTAGKADGLSPTFDRNWVMSDSYYTQTSGYTGDMLQAFLEETPYNKRSWLADERIFNQRFADVLAAAGKEYGINPVVLLARMQVEKSLISKSVRPSQRTIDRAFGCGCYDNRACLSSTLGLASQIDCAAHALRDNYDKSATADGLWKAGVAKKTLDPLWVTPANHATAALYAYTPWVLERRGGNWLVWNVTRRFQAQFDTLAPAADDGCANTGLRPFVGDRCTCEADCAFAAASGDAWCGGSACTIACEGYCPDLSGRAPTFCVADPAAPESGICVSKTHAINNNCEALPGTKSTRVARFIGNSGAPAAEADVCLTQGL